MVDMGDGKGELNGKVALVTGSTQGLGAGIARCLARAGARVVLSGRNRERGENVARSLGEAVFEPADLSVVDDCARLVDKAVGHWGRLDILVNSAGDTDRSRLETFTPELFDRQFHTNVRAPLLLAQAAVPHLKKNTGVIINIGSVNAYVGGESLLVYSATKGALMTASKNMAQALRNERVRVHCLNVGWVDTDGERVILAKEGKSPDFIERAGKRMPVGRLLQPEEIGQMCLFLAAPRGAVFSGAVIDLEQHAIGAHHSVAFEDF
jgi:NAD(P)-dependent dehydrogenase (short-subunit alcohol dehydrogenase family)